jgi:stage IV sporulation protein FB
VGLFKATEIAASCGKCLGVFFTIFGILLSYYDFMSLSLSLMGIFLYYAAGREQQSAVYVFLRYLLRKEKMLKKFRVLKSEQLVAMESTTVLEVLKRFKPTRYHQVIVLNQTCRVLELLSESQILEAALQKGMDVPLRGLIRK